MNTGIDEQKLHDLLGRAIVDFGAVSIAPLVLIGDQLGLYRGLTAHGPMTSAELATQTNTHERYVREWLNAQAGEARIRAVVTGAGFTRFRRATHSPFNLVYQARP